MLFSTLQALILSILGKSQKYPNMRKLSLKSFKNQNFHSLHCRQKSLSPKSRLIFAKSKWNSRESWQVVIVLHPGGEESGRKTGGERALRGWTTCARERARAAGRRAWRGAPPSRGRRPGTARRAVKGQALSLAGSLARGEWTTRARAPKIKHGARPASSAPIRALALSPRRKSLWSAHTHRSTAPPK